MRRMHRDPRAVIAIRGCGKIVYSHVADIGTVACASGMVITTCRSRRRRRREGASFTDNHIAA
jgi:hypothetical protein